MASIDRSIDEEHNREVVRVLFEEVWTERTFEGLIGNVALSATMHFRGASFSTNLDDLRGLVGYWHQAFSELRFRIGHLLAEDDMVAVRLTISGKHEGTWEGIAGTGRRVEFSEMMFFRFEDGMIVEMWEDYDEFGLRQQLGAVD